MRNNLLSSKQGMSTIIVTIIMIILVLTAVGVIWVIVQGVLEEGSSDIDLNIKCLKVNLVATKLDCAAASTCDVTLNRKSSGDTFDGIKLIFSNSTSGNVGTNVADYSGNIPELGTTVVTSLTHGLTSPEKPNTVEVVAYFLSESGKEQICPQSKSFKLL